MRLPAASQPLLRAWLLAWLLSSLLVTAPPVQAEGDGGTGRDLGTLLSHFAASRGVEASFREEKSLPLLEEPLVSEGVLYYAPPGRMVRFTHRPERTSLLLLDDRLRIEDGLGVEEIDLSAHAEARRFVAQLLLLFEGDREALERDYEVQFQGDGGAWKLLLRPRGLAMRAVIAEIALRGRRAGLDEMVVTGTEGEVTRTTYPSMRTDRPFRPEELARLFPDDGPPAPLPDADDAEPMPGAALPGDAAPSPDVPAR